MPIYLTFLLKVVYLSPRGCHSPLYKKYRPTCIHVSYTIISARRQYGVGGGGSRWRIRWRILTPALSNLMQCRPVDLKIMRCPMSLSIISMRFLHVTKARRDQFAVSIGSRAIIMELPETGNGKPKHWGICQHVSNLFKLR